MILAIVCVYLALGVLFYLRLTATATNTADMPRPEKSPSWHRVRRMTQAVMRRVRPLLPKR